MGRPSSLLFANIANSPSWTVSQDTSCLSWNWNKNKILFRYLIFSRTNSRNYSPPTTNQNGSALPFLQTTAVSTDPRAEHAFHFSQLHAILGRTSTLLEVFAAGFKDARGRIEEYVLLCRFFADSSLYFGLFDIPVAVGAACGQHSIAMYVLRRCFGRECGGAWSFLVSLGLEVGVG